MIWIRYRQHCQIDREDQQEAAKDGSENDLLQIEDETDENKQGSESNRLDEVCNSCSTVYQLFISEPVAPEQTEIELYYIAVQKGRETEETESERISPSEFAIRNDQQHREDTCDEKDRDEVRDRQSSQSSRITQVDEERVEDNERKGKEN